MKKIFGGQEEDTAAEREKASVPVVELSEPETEKAEGKPSGALKPIRVIKRDLPPSTDLGEVVETVQSGNAVFLDMAPLMDEDPEALKSSVDRLRREVGKFGGDIARVSDTLIVLVPMLVDVEFRGEESGGEQGEHALP